MSYIGNSPANVPIGAESIADGSITLAKLSVNSVDSSKIVVGGVDLSSTDVTGVLSVAKGGTGSSSNTIVTSVNGTSGNVSVQPTLVSSTNIKTINSTSLLGSGDVSVQPTLVSGTNIKTLNGDSLLGSSDITISSGSLIYLLTVTGTNAATIDVEHAFDSTYDEYILECVDLVAATADSDLRCRLKISGVYDATTTNYGTNLTAGSSNGGSGLTTSLSILGSGITTNSTTRPHSFSATIIKPFAAIQKKLFWNGLRNTSYATNDVLMVTGAGIHISTSPCTGFRFFMNSGNITSATFHLYGVKKS